MKRLVMVFVLVIPAWTQATPTTQWFNRQAEGWFWYATPPVEEGVKDNTDTTPPDPNPTLLAPKAALEALQEKLDNAQALAVMHPTTEHVAAYLHLQKQVMETSQRFAKVWQQVVWTTPELDHTLVRPTSPQAVNAYYDNQNAQRKVHLNTVAKTHGLFYFFRANCPYCQRFSPMLKSFAAQHGFHITAISLDGGPSPGFPNPRSDNGTARRLGVKTVPAVYLIEPRTRSVQPVSFGLVGPTELEQRIVSLINKPAGDPL